MSATSWKDVSVSSDDQEVSYSKEGWTCKRKIIFKGLTNTSSSTLTELLLNATICPQRGDAHETLTTILAALTVSVPNFAVDTVKANPVAGESTIAEVVLTYKNLSALTQEPDATTPAVLTIGGSVQSIGEQAYDVNGDPLSCPYTTEKLSLPWSGSGTPSSTYTIQDAMGNDVTSPTSSGTTDHQVPQHTLSFQRREPTGSGAVLAATFVGMMNSADFTCAGMSYPAHTLVFTKINVTTQDDGVSDIVEYEMQYNPETWDPYLQYNIPANCQLVITSSGLVVAGPGDIPPDVAIVQFQIRDDVDYDTLDLV